MTLGKKVRWSRFLYPASRAGLIVPVDHGLTVGPLPGLGSTAEMARWLGHSAITGLIAHKGIVERLAARDALRGLGVMVHVNGMSALAPTPDRKELLTSVEHAVRLGADGISLQINFDGREDAHNLQLLGRVVDEAQRYGLPVLTMLYDKLGAQEKPARLARLRHLLRIAIELGTDALKIAPPATLAEIPELLDGLADDAAIFFAGGARCEDEQTVALARAAVSAGGAGLCIGRNVFARRDPGELLSRLGAALGGRDAKPSRREAVALAWGEHGVH